MRGFVITILSVTLIVILVVLAISLRNAQLSTERGLIEPLPLTYAAFLLDDVGYEFNSLIGPAIKLDERNDSTILIISDSLHDYNHSADMIRYGDFLASEVAAQTSSNISANLTNITSGTITLYIDEDYVYTNNHTINESIFTRDGGTGATDYSVNLTVTAVRSNITHMPFNSSGTMNVTIQYTDLNGTGIEQGSVFPNVRTTLELDYAGGGIVYVTVGPQGGNSGSLLLQARGIGADVSWSAKLPAINSSKRLGYQYDATIDYYQGAVSKHSRIGK